MGKQELLDNAVFLLRRAKTNLDQSIQPSAARNLDPFLQRMELRQRKDDIVNYLVKSINDTIRRFDLDPIEQKKVLNDLAKNLNSSN